MTNAVPQQLIDDLDNLLALHGGAKNARDAFFKLGLDFLGYQDKEVVGIRDGQAAFDTLRVVQDRTTPTSVLNYRMLLQLLDGVGRTNAATLPFNEGSPQVLTAEGSILGKAEAVSGTTLLWSPASGVHWGATFATASGELPSTYVFGPSHLVVHSLALVFDLPAGYLRFPTLQALQEYCNTHVFFGDVHVYFKENANGSLSVANVSPPFSLVLHPTSGTVNDTLNISNTRLRIDCGDAEDPLPFNSPRLTFTNCDLAAASFLALDVGAATIGNFISLRNCRGFLTVFGGPTVTPGSEVLSVVDSDMVLHYLSEGTGYRTHDFQRSDIVVRGSASPLGVSYHTLVNVLDSRFQVSSAGPETVAAYWTVAEEATFVYNKQEPMYVQATASYVNLAHLAAAKPAWTDNMGLQKTAVDPLILAIGSDIRVLDIGDRGDQDLVVWTYRPPLTAAQSILLSASTGSRVCVGVDGMLYGGSSLGLYVDRPAIATAHGALHFTPVVTDSSSRGFVVELQAAPYTELQLQVLDIVSPLTTVFVPLTGVTP